jgi:hypothetical protein
MAIKKVLLTRKVNNILYSLYPKTTAEVVCYGDTNVAKALADLADEFKNYYTSSSTDDAIKTAVDNLYNKIMGITAEDGTSVNEAYDTLKEVATWINEHGDIAAGFATDISNLKTTVGDDSSGLVKDVTDLKNVGATKVEASSTNGNIKINGVETQVYQHPMTHSAAMIDETTDKKFVTKDEKEIINNAAAVKLISSESEVVNDRDFYMIELA